MADGVAGTDETIEPYPDTSVITVTLSRIFLCRTPLPVIEDEDARAETVIKHIPRIVHYCVTSEAWIFGKELL